MARASRVAYEELLRRYVAPLRRLSWSYEHEPAREDLFQEIAIALWTAFPQFRGDSSERTWIYRVAHNTAITFTAQAATNPGTRTATDTVAKPGTAPRRRTPRLEQQRRRALERVHALPVDDRQILVLHLEGLSADEIELVTGVSGGAVATRLTRLRQRLVARLRQPARRGREHPS